jgi:hypothetical protein
MVAKVGIEVSHGSEPPQLIDSTNSPKRGNRYFRGFEVHGGYTEVSEFEPAAGSGT